MPSRKVIQATLIEQEAAGGGKIGGAASWVAFGIAVEEKKCVCVPICAWRRAEICTRLTVARVSRQAPKSGTDKQRLHLAELREDLVTAIVKFHAEATKYFPTLKRVLRDPANSGAEWDDETLADGGRTQQPLISATRPLAEPIEMEDGDPAWEDDGRDEESDPRFNALLDIDRRRPEQHGIALPSTVGYAFLKKHRLTQLAVTQRELTRGVMNECIQKVRMGVGYKSMLYRKKVRKATGTKARLRSFDEIRLADEGVRKHVRVYMHLRKTLEALYDPDDAEEQRLLKEELQKYQEMRDKDLRADTTLIEAFMAGQRDKHPSWLWSFEDTLEGEAGQFVEQSKFFPQHSLLVPWHSFRASAYREFLIARRSIWLRSYARLKRWEEEERIVRAEMDWTVNYFNYRADQWRQWADGAGLGGAKADAFRTAAMWSAMAQHSRGVFDQILEVRKP